MYYGKIKKTDIANGTGVRVSLFVSGCRNRCKGCFNPETWDFYYGNKFTEGTISEIVEALAPSYISGLTILGGEPLDRDNIDTVTTLCRIVKKHFPNKTIWLYTGYEYSRIFDLKILDYLDVLVDGRYEEDKKDISLVFRGSSNQRIIDVPETIKTGKITEVKL